MQLPSAFAHSDRLEPRRDPLPFWARRRCESGRATLFVALVALAAPVARSQAAAQEFVRQTLMLATFYSPEDPSIGRRISDGVRSRIAKVAPKRELAVLDDYDSDRALLAAGFGYPHGAFISDAEVRVLARQLRVDEVVLGTVRGGTREIVVSAQIAMARDWRYRQPLPQVRSATAALAADGVVREVMRARAQMAGLRRCENALRVADFAQAAREAEVAIRAYPAATLARNCLLATLLESGVRSDSVQRIAEEVLARDSLNVFAAVARARALDAQAKPSESAMAWGRVVDIRPDSLDLGVTATDELLRLGRPTSALTAALALLTLHPGDPRLRRLRFRADVGLSHWAAAASLGDSLAREDPVFQSDSNYAFRQVEAVRQSGDTLGALAISVAAVKRHPGDSRIYTQYVQLLAVEGTAALPRGLLRFPDVSELYVLSARSARGAGRRLEAIAATQQAVRHDPQLTLGFLQLADLWLEEKRPDSALVALSRAQRTGAGAELLRTYIIARGGQLLRAAPDSEPVPLRQAAAFLVLADSLDSREDSRSYVAGATLQLARSELVVASHSRGCTEVRLADSALAVSANALANGVGVGAAADQLRQVFDSMRAAVDNAVKVYCKD